MSLFRDEPELPRTRRQYRMRRLQVFNWGTFSGLHSIPIAERGFLFVGPSGAGKSTLLDAFSALLIPPRWVDFNAAAREAERSGRDRNFVTYVRGAWSEQKDGDSGLIGTQFLRSQSTWSALALTFDSNDGRTVVLVQIFGLRGPSTAAANVKRHYLVFERPFDLQELADFDLDIRKLKRRLPEAFSCEEFSAYCERFRRLLGIDSELALRLLHKTQSAKNLGDLNEFLRDFMLDKPDTFAAAERLVSEFGELSTAHQAVLTAREQIATLAPARTEHALWREASIAADTLGSLRDGTQAFSCARGSALLGSERAALQVRAEGLEAELRFADQQLAVLTARRDDLAQTRRASGGEQIERWESEKAELERQRGERLAKYKIATGHCARLGWEMAASPSAFAEVVGRARAEVEDFAARAAAAREEAFALDRKRAEVEKQFALAVAEVRALQTQTSNIPAEMLALRRELAAALALPESALPFVGELIEVRADESAWQGAIERALRGFALSIVVAERHYKAFSTHVNSTHIGKRLVYHRVGPVSRQTTRLPPADSLVEKLTLKDGPFADWLLSELRHSFDFVCARNLTAFREADYALTREGQIRRGKSRHEKDDRSRIDDRRQWVLGFSNQEKLALFEAEAQALGARVEALRSEIAQSAKAEGERTERFGCCQSLMNTTWGDIDVESLVQRIAQISRDLGALRSESSTLRQIEERLRAAEDQVKAADKARQDLRDDLGAVRREAGVAEKRQEALRQVAAGLPPLSAAQEAGLDERLGRLGVSATSANLDTLMLKVVGALAQELEVVQGERDRLAREVERRFADFRRLWPAEAGDVDARLASAPDFFAKLDRLELDGLPAHEERFFDLLRNQSQQNLAALSTHLNQAMKEIMGRLELVNEGLRAAPFNPGTYLHIQAQDKQLPDVREFKQEIRAALSNAWDDSRDSAEGRFLVLRRLVERLGSQEAVDRRWRELVLDVRQHAEFVGHERDAEGKDVEIYRSGSGKSGGQRQKLATTCLAAALRYQLGGHERGYPVYAPVILDEAFDKADNEFTALAMGIFANFGFQMIIATPLKSVMTLEPFIGGACLVTIRGRRESGVLLIEYDGEGQRLRLPERQRGEVGLSTRIPEDNLVETLTEVAIDAPT